MPAIQRPDSAAPQITILLLNFKRPQNISIILDGIARQTLPARVFLWNNGEVDVNSPQIDWYERSDVNVGCMARWRMAQRAKTPFVMSMDDDLCFSRNDVLQQIVQTLNHPDNRNRIVGMAGMCFDRFPLYKFRRTVSCRRYQDKQCLRYEESTTLLLRDTAVDMIMGRLMAFRRNLLEGLWLPDEREDDIFLSATVAGGTRKHHRVPAVLNDAFYELPELGVGNWQQPGHFPSRERALWKYFAPHGLAGSKRTQDLFLILNRLLARAKRKADRIPGMQRILKAVRRRGASPE